MLPVAVRLPTFAVATIILPTLASFEFIFAIINKKLNNIDKLIQNIMKFTNMKFSSYNENYLLGLAPNLLNKDGTFKYKTEKEYLDFALNFNYDEYQNKIKNIYLKKILSKIENI